MLKAMLVNRGEANTKQSKTPSNEHQSKYIYFKLIYTKCRHVLNTQLLNINYEI